jgi:ABC-type Fe3+ transport system substrate-binding protein
MRLFQAIRHAGVRAALLAAAIVAGGALQACGQGDADVPHIDIVTSHGSNIRREFAQAFSDWHREKYGTAVEINYPDIGGGGTGNIATYLDKAYGNGAQSTFDIVWGGGSATFGRFQPFLVKPDLPQAVIDQVPHDIFGTPLHGPDDKWLAATMSNFGIVANKDRMSELGLSEPRVWADLAGPEWVGKLSLGDPSKSGSVLTSYDMTFVQYGWEKGWGLITQMFANAEAIRENGSNPADDVGSAQAVAGIVIDFYGRNHVIRVGPQIVEFIIPEGGSTIDADPIAMLRGAKHAELSAHFIEFVISPAGQRLWVFKAGVPGGPKRNVLGRLSILPELYKNESSLMFDATNPFAQAEALKADPKAQGWRRAFMGDLVKAALVDNFPTLTAARRAVIAAGNPPDLVEQFNTLPTYAQTTIGPGGELVYGEWKPVREADQSLLAAEYKPAAKDPKAAYADRIQKGLQNHWRQEFAVRLESLRQAAEARRK